MAHIPVVQRVDGRGVAHIARADRHGLLGPPAGGQGLFFRLRQPFEGGFGAQGFALVFAAARIGQLHGPAHARVARALPAAVAPQAAGQVAGPARIEAAVRAAHKVRPGGGRRGGLVFGPRRRRPQAQGAFRRAGGAHSLTGFPAARSARRQASIAVCLSSAVTRKRLGWQKRRPRPLRSRRTSSGWPAQAGGNGTLLRRVL